MRIINLYQEVYLCQDPEAADTAEAVAADTAADSTVFTADRDVTITAEVFSRSL